MEMVRALDAGPVYLQRSIPLDAQITLPVLHDKMAVCASQALQEYLENYQELSAQDQDQSQMTYCGKLVSEDGHLDFHLSVQEIDAWIRAYTPAPGCWLLADGERLRIHSAQPATEILDVRKSKLNIAQVIAENNRMFIGCADGALELLRIQPAGKRVMDVADFLNGRPLPQVVA